MSRDSVQRALAALLDGVRYRPPPSHGRPLPLPGHYAGLIRIGRETLAITTDTVGTKVRIAEQMGRWEEVGEDVVAVNVNDLAAVGARPAGLVDCILCARPDAKVFAALGRGIDRGLRASGCALLGGETAVVPDIVRGVDLGGTAIGFYPPGRSPVTGRAIRPGDLLVGLPSSGFHANGLTLVRRIVEESKLRLDRPRPGSRVPLGRELLRPTQIYVAAAEAAVGVEGLTGLAHISGGGVRNLTRLNPSVAFVLDAWPEPRGLFAWAEERGGLTARELYQTFNVGIGFVLVVRPSAVSALRRRLARLGAWDSRVIGRVERGRGVRLPQVGVTFEGYG